MWADQLPTEKSNMGTHGSGQTGGIGFWKVRTEKEFKNTVSKQKTMSSPVSVGEWANGIIELCQQKMGLITTFAFGTNTYNHRIPDLEGPQ